jgi:hypothetical protein
MTASPTALHLLQSLRVLGSSSMKLI